MNVLIIGLNDFSKKIVEHLKTTETSTFGFDFDIDKIELFYQENFIKNNSKVILQNLLKQADLLILNIEFSKYKNIFKLSPFVKNECKIIDINSCKETNNVLKEIPNNKVGNFLQCNFTFFPKSIVINFNVSTKMTTMSAIASFFKGINVKTSALTPEENNQVFSKIYHIPFLFDSTLFKADNSIFISKHNISESLYNDVVSNKINILNDLKNLLINFPNIKNEDKIISLLEENILLSSNNSKTDITRTIFGKVLIEKLMINLFQYRNLKAYIDNLELNYCNYKTNFLKKYYLENREDIEILLLLIKEKINNLICFLELENLTPSKLKKYLEN